MAFLYRMLFICAVLTIAMGVEKSHGEPYLAVREGLQCSACHVNQTGHGMRTPFGVTFSREELPMFTADSTRLMRQASQELTIGVDFRIVNHTSFKRDKADPPRHLTANSFFIEEANLYAEVNLIPDKLSFYLNEQISPQPTGSREIAGIFKGLPANSYLKVGQMFMPYGLRIWDRESFLLTKTGVLEPDFGFEVGLQQGPFALSAAAMNAEPFVARDTNTAKQFVARLTFASKYFWGGGSFNYNGKAQLMGGGFVGLSYGPFTVLHETDVLKLDRDFLTKNATQIVSYSELNLLLRKGFNVKAAFDYYDPDGAPDPGLLVAHKERRYRFGIEPVITPFFQTRIFYSIHRPKVLQGGTAIVGNNDQLLLEVHVFL